jgi:hypothetical protein
MLKYILTALVILLVGATIHLNKIVNPELQLVSSINLVLYVGLIFLALQIISKDTHFRSIFINLLVFFLINIVQSTAFTLNQIFGDEYSPMKNYVRWVIIMNLATCFIVLFILSKYLFPHKKTMFHYLSSAGVVLPIWLVLYFPFLQSINFIYHTGQPWTDPYLFYHPLFVRSIVMNLVALAAAGVFFYVKLRHDHPFGYCVDTLMFWLSFLVGFDVLHYLSRITNQPLFNFGQWATFLVLIFMGITLGLRLWFLSRHAGVFYESQIVSDRPFVDRRPGLFDRFIRWNFFSTEEIKKEIFLEVPKGDYKPKI